MSYSLVNGRKCCLTFSVPRSIGTYPPTYTTFYLGTGEILTPVAAGSSNLREFNFVSWTTVWPLHNIKLALNAECVAWNMQNVLYTQLRVARCCIKLWWIFSEMQGVKRFVTPQSKRYFRCNSAGRQSDMSAETRNIRRFIVVFRSPFKQTLDDNLQLGDALRIACYLHFTFRLSSYNRNYTYE